MLCDFSEFEALHVWLSKAELQTLRSALDARFGCSDEISTRCVAELQPTSRSLASSLSILTTTLCPLLCTIAFLIISCGGSNTETETFIVAIDSASEIASVLALQDDLNRANVNVI